MKRISLFSLVALAVGAATLAHPNAARADLGWEHIGTLRLTKQKQPLARFKMYNHWTPTRHRVLINYSFQEMPGGGSDFLSLAQSSPLESALAFSGGEPVAPLFRALTNPKMKSLAPPELPDKINNFGTLALVQRIDDDRVLAYESQTKQFISEARRTLLQRTTFDPFKNIEPRLSREKAPELSEAQRRRLAEEAHAFAKPFKRHTEREYFRALGGKTMYNLPARGYRYTILSNFGSRKYPQWARINMEWWLADEAGGDNVVRQFRDNVKQSTSDIAWPTTSMWLREMIKLSKEPNDTISRQVKNSFFPSGADDGGINVTPLHFTMTIVPPALQRAQSGDIRFDLRLARRETNAVPARVFGQPAGYKRLDIQPYLKETDPYFNGKAWNKAIDQIYDLMEGRRGY